MKMKFRNNAEPCIQYDVKNGAPVMEWDEIQGKYCECIELEVVGLAPLGLLTEATHPENVDAIDLAVYLTNKYP